MLNGYCLIAKDYKAEVVEFATLSTITMPDDSVLYFVRTKYGDEYMNEKDLSPTREKFDKECEELNKTFQRLKEGEKNFGNEKRIYHQRPNW